MSLYSQFAEYYEQFFPFREDVYNFLQSFVIEKPGVNVLDIGCGPGHYTGRFAESGWAAYGLDIDKKMIMTAKNKYENCDFFRMNMMNIEYINVDFEMIYSIGNVVSHLTKSEFADFLEEIYKILNDSGIWVFQVMNWDYVLTDEFFSFPTLKVEGEGIEFKREYLKISTEKIQFNCQLTDHLNPIFQDTTYLYPIHVNEYLKMHDDAGFELLGHYGGYNGEVFDKTEDCPNVFIFKKHN